jgi:hypothetical protein
MVRTKPWRLSGIVRTVLAAIALLSPLGPAQRAPWWEARLALTVRGDYAVKAPNVSFTGEFTYSARWAGTMERDGPDLLLYHSRTDEVEWEIREKDVQPGGTRILSEKNVPERPGLRVNYVLRLDRELLFDISVEGFKIPLGVSPDRFDLDLPCSQEHGGAAAGGYDDFVTRGTNRIAVGPDALEKWSLERSFSWNWKRERWTAAGSGTLWLAGSHRVTAVVTIIRHN